MLYSSNSIYRGFDFARKTFGTQKALFQFAQNLGYSVAQRISNYYIFELYSDNCLVATFVGFEA